MATELIERQLTPIEIKQRQVDHLRLLTEIDNYQSEIDEHRRCAKDAANEVARIQSRERELRRELRSGTCWESQHVEPRQKSLEFADTLLERPTDAGIDACDNDEPDPETDPKAPPSTFAEMYPPIRTHELLRRDLSVALSNRGERVPSLDELRVWHEDSGIFEAVANWARVAIAWMNASECNRLGIVLPGCEPMPGALEDLLGKPPRPGKKKRGARPLSSGKGET